MTAKRNTTLSAEEIQAVCHALVQAIQNASNPYATRQLAEELRKWQAIAAGAPVAEQERQP